jgi:hypothetical protein
MHIYQRYFFNNKVLKPTESLRNIQGHYERNFLAFVVEPHGGCVERFVKFYVTVTPHLSQYVWFLNAVV